MFRGIDSPIENLVFREATEARHDENPGDSDRDPCRVPCPCARHPQPEDDTPREDGLAGGADQRPVQRQEVDQELLGGRPAGHAFGSSRCCGEGRRGAPRAPSQDAERGTTEVALPRRHATPPGTHRGGAVDQRGPFGTYHDRRECRIILFMYFVLLNLNFHLLETTVAWISWIGGIIARILERFANFWKIGKISVLIGVENFDRIIFRWIKLRNE